ncbi:hypothetical protein [Companilactobacillus bobalius]|uniref:hypothetical protein n=1 Tax=Companilactobacillus bobalius TaxID=2801451 RepID=UPI0013026592|nr:hypothetical protein [Companilactobacillus bobalius]KAE9560661.1 hypothetical protein ATN92_11025 [Companilactobacillus bobalius]
MMKEEKKPHKGKRSENNDYLHSGGTLRSHKHQNSEGTDKNLIIPTELTRDALDGIKSADVNPTIPTSISYIPHDKVKNVVDLCGYLNNKSVTTVIGFHPNCMKTILKFNTLVQMWKRTELAKPNFTEI